MKIRIITFECVALLVALPLIAWSQTDPDEGTVDRNAEEARDLGTYLGMIEIRDKNRYKEVSVLVRKIQNQGFFLDVSEAGECANQMCQAFKKELVESGDGAPKHILRPLRHDELMVLAGMTADSSAMKLYGVTLMMAQNQLNRTIRSSVAGGLGGTMMDMLVGELDSDRGREGSARFFNPMTMFTAGGAFAVEAGSVMDNARDSLLRGHAEAQEEELQRRAIIASAVLARRDEILGVPTQSIDVPNINQTVETDDGDEVTLDHGTFWVTFPDLSHNIGGGAIAKQRMEGTTQDGGEARRFFVESTNSDYRQIAGTDLVEPFKTEVCMGGLMSPQELEQLKEAQAQLAEFEQQLAEMPASQRQMMENMMGSQLDTVRSMANDGKLCHTQVTEAIFVNPDLKALYSAGPMDGVVMPTTAGEGNLVQRIQLDLTTMGYEPGNITGELTMGTVIAISQYQAERDMDVTGEPTQELAETITAEFRQ